MPAKRKATNVGRGYLRCHICGDKLRDHPIGRCPTVDAYDTEAFKGPARRRGRRRASDIDNETTAKQQTGR